MAKGVASQSVASEQDRINEQNQRANGYTEVFGSRCIGKPKSIPSVPSQKEDEGKREIEKVTVNILEDEREVALTPISLARLADRAIDGIEPESLVVSPTIIITGETKARRNPHD